MIRFALAAVLTFAITASAAAQSSEIGAQYGGSKRLNDVAGTQGQNGINDFKLSNTVREVYWGTRIDTATFFKIKVGQIKMPLPYSNGNDSNGNPLPPTFVKGTIDHIDLLVDYRFSEPFGSTGIFAGPGMYRQKATGYATDTNFGFSGGVNADLPLTRRFGITGEATYQWLHTSTHQRFITGTAGLRMSF